MNSCPKVSLLTISIIFPTRLSSNLSKMSSNNKIALRHFVFFFQIQIILKLLKDFLLPLRTKFLMGVRRFQTTGRLMGANTGVL
jgi:hypothetical protein